MATRKGETALSRAADFRRYSTVAMRGLLQAGEGMGTVTCGDVTKSADPLATAISWAQGVMAQASPQQSGTFISTCCPGDAQEHVIGLETPVVNRARRPIATLKRRARLRDFLAATWLVPLMVSL